MEFAKRVTVIDPVSGRILDHMSKAAAINQLARGLIAAHLLRNGLVIMATRTESLAENEARPGSFGIRRQRSETVGTLFFQHKGHYGKALSEA